MLMLIAGVSDLLEVGSLSVTAHPSELSVCLSATIDALETKLFFFSLVCFTRLEALPANADRHLLEEIINNRW